ncbi:MAG: hypothetical protein AAB821_01610 [Patescibacteria group bacterium]
MERPKQKTQEKIAEIEKSRTISDAELLKGGAEYVVDTSGMKRLVLNTEQLYEAERNGGENIFSASHLFLQTPKKLQEINLEGFNSNYIYFDNESNLWAGGHTCDAYPCSCEDDDQMLYSYEQLKSFLSNSADEHIIGHPVQLYLHFTQDPQNITSVSTKITNTIEIPWRDKDEDGYYRRYITPFTLSLTNNGNLHIDNIDGKQGEGEIYYYLNRNYGLHLHPGVNTLPELILREGLPGIHTYWNLRRLWEESNVAKKD